MGRQAAAAGADDNEEESEQEVPGGWSGRLRYVWRLHFATAAPAANGFTPPCPLLPYPCPLLPYPCSLLPPPPFPPTSQSTDLFAAVILCARCLANSCTIQTALDQLRTRDLWY